MSQEMKKVDSRATKTNEKEVDRGVPFLVSSPAQARFHLNWAIQCCHPIEAMKPHAWQDRCFFFQTPPANVQEEDQSAAVAMPSIPSSAPHSNSNYKLAALINKLYAEAKSDLSSFEKEESFSVVGKVPIKAAVAENIVNNEVYSEQLVIGDLLLQYHAYGHHAVPNTDNAGDIENPKLTKMLDNCKDAEELQTLMFSRTKQVCDMRPVAYDAERFDVRCINHSYKPLFYKGGGIVVSNAGVEGNFVQSADVCYQHTVVSGVHHFVEGALSQAESALEAAAKKEGMAEGPGPLLLMLPGYIGVWMRRLMTKFTTVRYSTPKRNWPNGKPYEVLPGFQYAGMVPTCWDRRRCFLWLCMSDSGPEGFQRLSMVHDVMREICDYL